MAKFLRAVTAVRSYDKLLTDIVNLRSAHASATVYYNGELARLSGDKRATLRARAQRARDAGEKKIKALIDKARAAQARATAALEDMGEAPDLKTLIHWEPLYGIPQLAK